jgi:predicted enzyme related to lactoylglutathione lyase
MITAVHTLVYAEDADAARAFFRDVLGWPHVDAGGGWLIFKTGPSELGVHPTAGGEPHHAISLMCDDIEATLEELRAKGAVVTEEIVDAGFGRTAMIEIPGGAGDLQIYQPRHPSAFDLASS